MKSALGKDSLAGVHIVIQGPAASPRASPAEPRAEAPRLTLTDIDRGRAEALAAEWAGNGAA